MHQTSITGVHAVAVPVADQDRSVAFYVDTLGFEKRMDADTGNGLRWIEIAPPGADISIALTAATSDSPAGIDTGIRLATGDAAGEHRAMRSRGVDVDEMLHWPNMPAMFTFRDPDRNTFYVVETRS
jgi:catechol 2,3-dioxygenase-like lactoylglutathione lyase family enzyme